MKREFLQNLKVSEETLPKQITSYCGQLLKYVIMNRK